MELRELVEYAESRHHIPEEHKWADFPGFSVLCDPVTHKWAALLMRQWDSDSGRRIECCDIKCGRQILEESPAQWLSLPFRMRGPKWVGVRIGKDTDRELVFRLFDRALTSFRQGGATLVIPGEGPRQGYHDTPLPFAPRPPRQVTEEPLPKKIRIMRTLYTYRDGSIQGKYRNFYLQAKFMKDYEDEYPWSGRFDRYMPTYQDMNERQLRGYFSWRTHLKKGDWQPIPVSAAYLYLYELLNDVGIDSAEDGLEKMCAFETGFLDAGYGDAEMRKNLRRWMLDWAVLSNLAPEEAQRVMSPEALNRDRAMTVLKQPENYPDGDVFEALCAVTGYKAASSPVLKRYADQARRLFGAVWREAMAGEKAAGRDLFTACFGKKILVRWYPLGGAVIAHYKRNTDHYTVNENRAYHYRYGSWYLEAYSPLAFDRKKVTGLMRETDLKLRQYFKTGSYLKAKDADAWADPAIDRAIAGWKEEEVRAARAQIKVDLTGLDQIRRDAVWTRDSLLTQADLDEAEEAAPVEMPSPAEEAPGARLPLDRLQHQVVETLLAGGDPGPLIREHHQMPSVLADDINEALFDLFGDSVLMCEEDGLLLVEDYRDELSVLLKGEKE